MTQQTEKALLDLAAKLATYINPSIASNRKERKAITGWNNDRMAIALHIRKIVNEEQAFPPQPCKHCGDSFKDHYISYHCARLAGSGKEYEIQSEPQPQPEPQP